MDSREFDALMSAVGGIPENTSGTASFSDYLRALMSGFANIGTTAGQGVEFLSPELGRPLRELGQNAEDYWGEGMTSAGREIASGRRLAENPLATIGLAATQSAPGVLAMAIPGAWGAKVLQGTGVAGNIAKGIGAIAPRFAPTAEGVAGALGASISEGGYSALSNAAGTMKEALETLARERPELSPEDRYAMATDAAQQTALMTAPWTGATGLLTGGGALGPLLSRFAKDGAQDVARTGFLKTVGKAMGAEAGQEFLQSGGEQYLQNIAAANTFAPSRDPWSDVLNQAIIGGGAGGLMGGVMGGVQHVGNRAQQSIDDIKMQNANELANMESRRIQQERDTDLLSRSQTGDELFNALGIDPKEAAARLNDLSPDLTNVAPDIVKALEGASPTVQQEAVRNYLTRLAAVVTAPMAPKVERTLEQATILPEMSLQDSINAMLGIGRKLHSREDVRKAVNEETAPTVVVGQDGLPKVTTKAWDVYQAEKAGWPEARTLEPPKILNVATNRAWAFENSDVTPAPAFTSATTKNWVVVENPDTKQSELLTKADAAKKYGIGNDQIAAFKAAKIEEMLAKTDVTEIAAQGKEVIPSGLQERQGQTAPQKVAVDVEPEKGVSSASKENLPQVRQADKQVPLRQKGALLPDLVNQLITEPAAAPAQALPEVSDAVQKQTANEGVLLAQRPEMGLQEVGEGNAQSQVTTKETRKKTKKGKAEVVPTIKQARTQAKADASKVAARELWDENHPEIPYDNMDESLRSHWEGIVNKGLGTIEASDRIAKAHELNSQPDDDETRMSETPKTGKAAAQPLRDSNKFIVTQDESGNPVFMGDKVSLDTPHRQGRGVAKGSDAVQYVIRGTDGEVVGIATLELADGEPQAILDIVVQDALQGKGWGEKVVAGILAGNGDKPLYLEGVLRDAEGFWRKLGAFVDEGTRRGEISWDDYAASRAERDAVSVPTAEQGGIAPAPVEAEEPIGPIAVDIPFETADGKKGNIRIDDAQQAVRDLTRTINDYKALLKCLT